MSEGSRLLLGLVLHIWFGFCIYVASKKTRIGEHWLAFLPLGNLYVLCKAAGQSGWLVLVYFVPFGAPILWGILWMETGRRLGLPRWVGALELAPLPMMVVGLFLASSGEPGALLATAALAGLIFLLVPAVVAGAGRTRDEDSILDGPGTLASSGAAPVRRMSAGRIVNEKREGPWTLFYETGAKQEEGEYRAGERQGRWVEWWPNGVKRAEGEYAADRRHGEWEFFEQDGQFGRAVSYVDGVEEMNGESQ